MSEEGAAYWESVGKAWSHERPQRLWRTHSDAVNRALLERWLPSGIGGVLKTDAFDEAFGEGVADLLARRAAKTWMIDVSATALAEARRSHPRVRTVVADVRGLPFPAGSFDAAVSLSTLDHFDRLPDLEAGLSEIRRVLRRGGRLVITLDNPENPAVALRNRLPQSWLRRIGLVPYHVGETLDRAGLVQALDRAGFDVLDLDAIQHAPRAPAVAAARVISGAGGKFARRGFLRAAAGLERLGGWHTRFRTGYFVAALGVRR